MAIKDRSNLAAYVTVLEAIAVTLLRERVAGIDAPGRQAVFKSLGDELTAICGDIAAAAPVTGRGAGMAPAAAKKAASRIATDAQSLLKEFEEDLAPASAKS